MFNPNPFLFSSVFYSTPPPPPPSLSSSSSPSLFFQAEPSVRLYHDVLFRNLVEQYSQSVSLASSPPTSLILPSSISIPTIAMKNESHVSLTAGHSSRKKPTSTLSSSSLKTKLRRRLACPQCSYTTNRLNNLKRHIQTMHEILTEPIDCCHQLFVSKAQFRAHVNAEHRCGYLCDICRRTFCRKALLRRHQSIHSGQKAFVCQICSYSTSHKGNLDRHTRIHRHQNEQKNISV